MSTPLESIRDEARDPLHEEESVDHSGSLEEAEGAHVEVSD